MPTNTVEKSTKMVACNFIQSNTFDHRNSIKTIPKGSLKDLIVLERKGVSDSKLTDTRKLICIY